MGDAFEDEADHSAKFDDAMGNFLLISQGPTELQARTLVEQRIAFLY